MRLKSCAPLLIDFVSRDGYHGGGGDGISDINLYAKAVKFSGVEHFLLERFFSFALSFCALVFRVLC